MDIAKLSKRKAIHIGFGWSSDAYTVISLLRVEPVDIDQEELQALSTNVKTRLDIVIFTPDTLRIDIRINDIPVSHWIGLT